MWGFKIHTYSHDIEKIVLYNFCLCTCVTNLKMLIVTTRLTINDSFLRIKTHTQIKKKLIGANKKIHTARNQFWQSVNTLYLIVAEPASKFRHQRYYRKKDESHGHFLHFNKKFEGYIDTNHEFATCRGSIFWKWHWFCVDSAGNMGRWSKIVHAGSSNTSKMHMANFEGGHSCRSITISIREIWVDVPLSTVPYMQTFFYAA